MTATISYVPISWAPWLPTYNFARRHKPLMGLMTHEYLCKVSASEPDRFVVDQIHQMLRLGD